MRLRKLLILGLSASLPTLLSACSIAKGYSDSEKEMVNTMTPSKYQPATRDMRTSIETQDVLSQAAFWSREYQLNPADLEAAVKLASAVRRMGNAAKAAEITQTTRAMYPDDPYLIAEHSAALIALEKGQEAIRPLDKALHSAPGYARLWSLKGAALDQMGQYPQARQHYNRAMQITPNDPNILANMGLSFALAGDPASAEQWLRRAASHPEAGDGIRQNLNLVLQLQGKPTLSSAAEPKALQQPSVQRQSAPQARGVYTPVQRSTAPQPARQTLPQATHFGHRSNIAVMGNQPGAPKTAAEAARAAAAQSTQPRTVVPQQGYPQMQGQVQSQVQGQMPGQIQGQVPMQTQARPQGDILELIARSNSQRRAQAAPYGQQPVPQTAPQPYLQPGQIAPSQPQMSYGDMPARRGAARRR